MAWMNSPDEAPKLRIGRRDIFTAVGAAAVGGVAGWALRGTGSEPGAADPAPSQAPSAAPAGGVPGITLPAVPQRHARLTVLAVDGPATAVLDAARRIAAVDPAQPADAGEVSVTIGFAPHIARELWPERATAEALPRFASDAEDIVEGGELAIQVCAETAPGARGASARILGEISSRIAWQADGYRDAPTPEGTARTNIGFIDGIINPRSAEELAAGVFTAQGDTYAVLRRIRIAQSFLDASVADQEGAIGRSRETGAPLSGGSTMDEIDLFAKTDAGRTLIPAAAHARRAHPANIGRPLMLRRSYSIDAAPGAGLLFAAFMNDPQTFTATQRRLDEMDDLIRHTTTEASGVFFVPAELG